MNQSEIGKISDRKRPHVKLAGQDGNAFAIMRRVRDAMRKVGWTKAEINEATDDMMSGDYSNLVQTACDYCEVD